MNATTTARPTPTLRGHWLTPDRGRQLLVVGPSLGTGVVALWDGCAQVVSDRAEVDVLGWDLPGHGDGEPFDEPFSLEDLASAVVTLVDRARPGSASCTPVSAWPVGSAWPSRSAGRSPNVATTPPGSGRAP